MHDVTQKWNDPDQPIGPRAVDNKWLTPTILQVPVTNVCAVEESDTGAGEERCVEIESSITYNCTLNACHTVGIC